jgi:hypothetical protein
VRDLIGVWTGAKAETGPDHVCQDDHGKSDAPVPKNPNKSKFVGAPKPKGPELAVKITSDRNLPPIGPNTNTTAIEKKNSVREIAGAFGDVKRDSDRRIETLAKPQNANPKSKLIPPKPPTQTDEPKLGYVGELAKRLSERIVAPLGSSHPSHNHSHNLVKPANSIQKTETKPSDQKPVVSTLPLASQSARLVQTPIKDQTATSGGRRSSIKQLGELFSQPIENNLPSSKFSLQKTDEKIERLSVDSHPKDEVVVNSAKKTQKYEVALKVFRSKSLKGTPRSLERSVGQKNESQVTSFNKTPAEPERSTSKLQSKRNEIKKTNQLQQEFAKVEILPQNPQTPTDNQWIINDSNQFTLNLSNPSQQSSQKHQRRHSVNPNPQKVSLGTDFEKRRSRFFKRDPINPTPSETLSLTNRSLKVPQNTLNLANLRNSSQISNQNIPNPKKRNSQISKNEGSSWNAKNNISKDQSCIHYRDTLDQAAGQ